MSTIGKSLHTIFREACDADYYESTWFKDNEPASSFIPTLDQLTAEQASTPPMVGRNSVAAHAYHIHFAFQALLDYLHTGQNYEKLDWESSWARQAVNAEQWLSLRTELRQQVQEIADTMVNLPAGADEDTLTGAVALVAHCAYHLGAIRQIAHGWITRS